MIRPSALAVALLAAALAAPAAFAQNDALQAELAAIRELRNRNRVADASDRAADATMQQALEKVTALPVKEAALWEIADIHLTEANNWAASENNGYAKRAIDAWGAYIDFALDNGLPGRLHRAVEYLQRSFMQANEYPRMFSQLSMLPPMYVNDKVVTRWEDRLRACADYSRAGQLPWVEKQCAQEDCRDAVGGFYEFAQRWLGEFPMKSDVRSALAQRVARIPQSCRAH